jgi:hypothetical protein
MNKCIHFLIAVMLLTTSVTDSYAESDSDQIELYKDNRFALGIGAAIVKFDTKMKFTDKESDRSIFLDPEGNLDLPETSSVTTFYGVWNINPKHSISFSFFNVNRESEIFSFDETLEDIRVVGQAKISDTTDFYRLSYGYTLFNDYRSKIKFHAGVYGVDLKYVFEAEGEITEDGVTRSDAIQEEAKVFAPLPLIGLDLSYNFTPKWAITTKVGFVAGSYEDLSATVLQTNIHAHYSFTNHVGLLFGLAYFDADIEIEDELELKDIVYGYDGGYIGMHFMF